MEVFISLFMKYLGYKPMEKLTLLDARTFILDKRRCGISASTCNFYNSSIAYLFFIIYSKSTVGQPTHKLEFMQHYFIPSQSFLYIYYSLILTSFPMKLSIKFFLYKRSINDHIAILYNI